MNRSAIRVAVLLTAVFLIGQALWANSAPVIVTSVTGTVWRVNGNMVPAPYSDPSGTLLGTFTANKIDFWAAGPQDSAAKLGDFLSWGGAVTSGGFIGLGDAMSSCFDSRTHASGCYSTIIRVDGGAAFRSGEDYTLRHDDGAVMYVDGALKIDAPTPVSPTDTVWHSNISGWKPFRIYYSGTNGNPEQLKLSGNVPDGGTTIMLLGCAIFGVEALRRRLRA